MKLIRFIPLVVLSIFLLSLFPGCPARSLHPLFTEKEAVLLASLIGTWENSDESYTFEPLQGNNYRLVIHPKEDNDSSVYIVQSGKIGNTWFLDSYPIVNSDEFHYLSMHMFTRLSLYGDSLVMESLEADWLLKKVKSKSLKVAHVMRENEVILTATTKELQRFIASIEKNSEAFPEPSTFHKILH